MFGLEARHIKTLIVRQPGANACESKTTRIETDGWYADLPEHAACAAAVDSGSPGSSAGPTGVRGSRRNAANGRREAGFRVEHRDHDDRRNRQGRQGQGGDDDGGGGDGPAGHLARRGALRRAAWLHRSDELSAAAAGGFGQRHPRRRRLRIDRRRHEPGRAQETGRHPDRRRRVGEQQRPHDADADASRRPGLELEQGAVRGGADFRRHTCGPRSRRLEQGVRLRARQRHRRGQDIEAEQGRRDAARRCRATPTRRPK